jgi:uncharacterized protein (DUF302 family)
MGCPERVAFFLFFRAYQAPSETSFLQLFQISNTSIGNTQHLTEAHCRLHFSIRAKEKIQVAIKASHKQAMYFGDPHKEQVMKKPSITFLLILLTVLPLMAAEGLVKVQSDFSVKETGDRLEKILNEKGMTIFKQINHSDAAQKVGVELRATRLILFGNPKVGSPLMQCQQSVAIDLPQKAIIWEDDKSRVWISYNDPGYLVKRHNIVGCDEVITKVEKALSGITKAAATK